MTAFKTHSGNVAIMNRVNVDTDQIIPKQFLKRVERTGYGQFLFYNWRFDEANNENPEFELNQPQFSGASILIAGENFGCGSSREHAVWALADYGFKVVISERFADIFYNNCFKNGLLPISLKPDQIQELTQSLTGTQPEQLTIDLAQQLITTPQGTTISFKIDSAKKQALIEGKDEISKTLEQEAAITQFEAAQKENQPWIWERPS